MWVILQRELLIRGRSWSTWAMRLLVTLAALVVIALYFLVIGLAGGGRQSGEVVFLILFYGLMVFGLFEGIRTSALGITEERQDGTLGLLFLTPLSSLDVLLGKLSGAGLTALYGLIAVIPVLAFPLILGGVTFGEVFRAAVVLLNTLALSLSCGLMGSVRSRDGIAAIVRATGWLIGLLILPLLIELGLQSLNWTNFGSRLGPAGAASPAAALLLARDAAYASSATSFWIGQLASFCVAGILVAVAARRLNGTWRQDESLRLPSATTPKSRTSKAPSNDAVHTLGAVVARRAGNRRSFWSVIGLSFVAHLPSLLQTGGAFMAGLSIVFLPLTLAGLASNLVLIYVSARTYSEARQTGEMEILLTTPVEDREIVRTLWLALRPFIAWLTVVSVAVPLLGFVIRLFTVWPTEPLRHEIALLLGQLLTQGFGTFLFASACVWVGMWQGLTARKVGGAVGWTFLLVGIVTPIVTGIAGSIGIGVLVSYVGMDLVTGAGASGPMSQALRQLVLPLPSLILNVVAYLLWIRWARKCLYTRFRAEASRSDSVARHWVIPLPTPPPLPPPASF
jgi:ABC-type transport system involved in multi-copper enzyme maturation permease subunit